MGVRDKVMQDFDRVTGMQALVSQTDDARETLGGQRLKANGGQTRIEDRREEVGRFARDVVRLVAEVIAKHFQPETLIEISGILYEEGIDPASMQPVAPDAPPIAPPTAPQAPGMAPPGGQFQLPPPQAGAPMAPPMAPGQPPGMMPGMPPQPGTGMVPFQPLGAPPGMPRIPPEIIPPPPETPPWLITAAIPEGDADAATH